MQALRDKQRTLSPSDDIDASLPQAQIQTQASLVSASWNDDNLLVERISWLETQVTFLEHENQQLRKRLLEATGNVYHQDSSCHFQIQPQD